MTSRIRLPKLPLVEPVSRWWDRLPWWGKAIVFIAIAGPGVVVPDHARAQLAERPVLPGRRLHPPRPRPQRRGRARRPARPRLRGVLRGRRLHDGQARRPRAGSLTAWEALPAGHRRRHGGGRDPRRSHAAPPGRLPGHRHARLRRDRAHRRPRTARVLGEARGITGIPHPSSIFGAEFGTRAAALLLPRPRRHRPRDPGGRAAEALAGRAGVGGHPGGRGRGRGDGRAHVQDEAVGVRHGRRHRRPGGLDLRQQGRASSTPTTSRSSCRS